MARPPTTPVRQRKNRVLNLPLGEGAARRRRKRGGTRSDLAPPHTRPGFAGPPSPRRGSSTFPWGKVPPAGSPRRRKPSPPGKVAGPKALTDEGSQPTKRTGPGLNFQGSPPHPSGLRPATLSKQERALSLPLGEGAARRRRKRGGTRSDLVPPHTRPGSAGQPSPGRGFEDSANHAHLSLVKISKNNCRNLLKSA